MDLVADILLTLSFSLVAFVFFFLCSSFIVLFFEEEEQESMDDYYYNYDGKKHVRQVREWNIVDSTVETPSTPFSSPTSFRIIVERDDDEAPTKPIPIARRITRSLIQDQYDEESPMEMNQNCRICKREEKLCKKCYQNQVLESSPPSWTPPRTSSLKMD